MDRPSRPILPPSVESFARPLATVDAPHEAGAWFPIIDQHVWHEAALQDPLAYWRSRVDAIAWERTPQRTFEGKLGDAHWFADGRLNVTVSCLDRHAESHPDAIAYHSLCENGASRSISYSDLLSETNRLANALAADGVGAGDRIAIYLPLSIEGVVAMLACARLGAIHCVIYAGMGAGALTERIGDAGADLLIAGDVTYRRGKTIRLDGIVAEAAARLPNLRRIVMWRREPPAESPLDSGEVVRDWAAYVSAHPDVRAPAIVAAEHPLFVLHTSGTTGKPKGIVHNHGGYLVGAAALFAEMTGLTPRDVLWCTSDLGWMTGHTQIVYGVLCNRYCCVIREGAPDYPSVDATYETIERYGVTQMYIAPTFARMLASFGSGPAHRHELATLRAIYCGGEQLDPAAWRFLFEEVGREKVAVCQHWGQTETGAPSLGYLPTSAVRPDFTGMPFGPLDIDVVDARGARVAAGSGGFLAAKAPWPHLFAGVWGDAPRYAEYFSEIPGWYATGDLATRDAGGYINVVGRADDVLNVAGHRIGPAEIEAVLNAHEACAESAVIGKPDDVRGERIKAFVRLAAGRRADERLAAELIERVRRELGALAAPAEIEFSSEIPKTRSGKIMRRLLRAREIGGDPGDLTSLED